jgi:diguanylate cyclase (GGDEF)-like protein/PAS domain S-box-containing protein
MVEDDPSDAELVLRTLRAGGMLVDCTRVDRLAEIQEAFRFPWDLVLCDHSVRGSGSSSSFRSSDVLALARVLDDPPPFIIISGAIGEDEVVRALHSGVAGYVEKSHLGRLIPAIERALGEARRSADDRRLRAEAAASRERLEILQAAVDAAFDLICVLEAQPEGPPRIIYANAAAERLTGRSPEDLFAVGIAGLCGPSGEAATARMLAAIEKARPVTVEVEHRNLGGKTIWIETGIRPIAPGSNRFISVSRDVTARKTVESDLAFLAMHDPLTGLSNRMMLLDHLGLELAAARRTGLNAAALMVDLDGFKRINDTLGHGFGDAVLRETARRLRACVRENDTVARLGGDEFVVVIGDLAGLEPVVDVARRLVSMASIPVEYNGERRSVSASIGIGLSPAGARSSLELLADADAAMYRVKRGGGNGYIFHE